MPKLLQGFHQVYEHAASSCHWSAFEWWTATQARNVQKVKEGENTSFVQVSAKAEPNCLYLWDPDIISCFSGDDQICRVQPKTLFVINKLSMHCHGLPDHSRCSNYNASKKFAPCGI